MGRGLRVKGRRWGRRGEEGRGSGNETDRMGKGEEGGMEKRGGRKVGRYGRQVEREGEG